MIDGHARLDLELFTRIASALGISRRYVGEEPFSEVTGIYNRIMQEALPDRGVEYKVIPRKKVKADSQESQVISASVVRILLKEGNFDLLPHMVPGSTLRYFQSEEAAPVLARIRAAKDVRHY